MHTNGIASNPLAAKRQSITPILKSSSRTSLTGTVDSKSTETLAKFQALNDVPLRPNTGRRTSAQTTSPSAHHAPAAARVSMPSFPSCLRALGTQHRNAINLEDSLRKQTLMHTTNVKSTDTDNTPARRVSSAPIVSSKDSLPRCDSSAAIANNPSNIQVMRRSVSIVGSSNMLPSTPTTSSSQSVLEIRSQIPCRNLKANGVCPFGARCHYRHDNIPLRSCSVSAASGAMAAPTGDADVDQKILGIRSQIPCRNFALGVCTFGNRCFYKHCDAAGKIVEETGVGSLSAMSLLRFPNPYGDGDICAAGVIPYARSAPEAASVSESEGFVCPKSKKSKKSRAKRSSSSLAAKPVSGDEEVWALLQVEDMLNEETGKWSAALAMFGGKVGAQDQDWLHTAAREFSEETGFLVGDVKNGIPRKMAQFTADDEDTAFSYTKYLEFSKFQCLYFPVTDAADLSDMKALPKRYWDTFKGEVSKDWTRAATRLEPVLLLRSKSDPSSGWRVCDGNTREPHALPLKVPLVMALRAAEFPWPAAGASPATAAPSQDTKLADLLGGLESLLNFNPTGQSSPVRHSRRRSSITAPFALQSLDESPHEAAYASIAMRGSQEIACI